jgi:PBP1b-binding outer membrane lipoprotein LpoB
MKKISQLIPLLVCILILMGCSKNKQEIIDKCLLQANQTFPTDLSQKSKLFQGCMAKYKYAFNAHSCDQNNQEHLLSEICYVKY